MLLIKTLGSLTFALILIGLLALTLIISTSLESLYGTPFAQKFFYQAGWFDVFLSLVAVNIACSAASRWPFKKKHAGFVITHAGIFLLLIGSLLSRLYGVDGQMMLYENETKDRILENQHELFLHIPGKTAAYDLKFHGLKKRKLLARINGDTELFLERAWDQALVESEWTEGPDTAPLNAAVQLTLTSQLAGANNTFWLAEDHPTDPTSSSLSMGPATIELRRKKPVINKPVLNATGPVLHIYTKDSSEALMIDLTNIPKDELALPSTSFRIVNIKYFPDARVEDNKLITVSAEPNNPAVVFDLYNSAGKHRHYAKFLFFPEFESMHGRDEIDDLSVESELIVPSATPSLKKGPSLTIYPGTEAWSYESRSSKSSTDGTLEAGKTYSTGWMDFSFKVEKLLTRAALDHKVRLAQNGQKGQIAVELSLVKNGREVLAKDWVSEEHSLSLPIGEGQAILAMIRAKNRPAPFQLTLKDFRKIDYPGTNRPASFESDVRLHDTVEHFTIEKTISMNKPLDYKGYRIFQSSFVQDPQAGEASVFTVAKNPGIFLIYAGAIVTFLGGFLVFFVPAFSSLKF